METSTGPSERTLSRIKSYPLRHLTHFSTQFRCNCPAVGIHYHSDRGAEDAKCRDSERTCEDAQEMVNGNWGQGVADWRGSGRQV